MNAKEQLLEIARKDIHEEVDGCVYWWPTVSGGCYNSFSLRVIADELDLLNGEVREDIARRNADDLRAAQIRALESLQGMYAGGDIACADDEIAAMRTDIAGKIEDLKNGGELI